MCSGFQITSNVLVALFLVVGVRSGIPQHRFLQQVRLQAPKLWRQLASRRPWFLGNEGDDSHNAGLWYLILHAEYRNLDESSLRLLGAQAWRSTYFAIMTLILLGAVIGITQASPSLSCLWH